MTVRDGRPETAVPLEWNRLYYDSVEHLLWNPSWISGTQPDGKPKTIRMLMERLRGLEAPLHHAFQVFFTLAPSHLISKLLRVSFNTGGPVQVVHSQTAVPMADGNSADLGRLCQPDILIEGPGAHVAVEVKAKSKSSLDQVLKYAAMFLLRGAPQGTRKHLVYVAPYKSFAGYWPRGLCADVDALRRALLDHRDDKLEAQLRRFGTSLIDVKHALGDLTISWRSVHDMRQDVLEEMASSDVHVPQPGAEVYAKLLAGFEKELQRWQDQQEGKAQRA
jgi:hypothetical protein